jgi:hypothetical protein
MARTVVLQPDTASLPASVAANTSAVAANAAAIAANTSAISANAASITTLQRQARLWLVWGANNDNGAANGWPIANGNPINSNNNGSEVASIMRLPAGTVLSNLQCIYANANPVGTPVYTLRKNGSGNTTMADTAITCTVVNATINGASGGIGSDVAHSETVLDSGDGYGYVSLHKTGGSTQLANYAGTFTLQATLP